MSGCCLNREARKSYFHYNTSIPQRDHEVRWTLTPDFVGTHWWYSEGLTRLSGWCDTSIPDSRWIFGPPIFLTPRLSLIALGMEAGLTGEGDNTWFFWYTPGWKKKKKSTFRTKCLCMWLEVCVCACVMGLNVFIDTWNSLMVCQTGDKTRAKISRNLCLIMELHLSLRCYTWWWISSLHTHTQLAGFPICYVLKVGVILTWIKRSRCNVYLQDNWIRMTTPNWSDSRGRWTNRDVCVVRGSRCIKVSLGAGGVSIVVTLFLC